LRVCRNAFLDIHEDFERLLCGLLQLAKVLSKDGLHWCHWKKHGNMLYSSTRGVSHIEALPFTLKYLKAKEELWKLKYFHHAKNIIFKKSSKRNQNPSRYYYNSRTNGKFQHKPKYHLSKILL
jgi:hypothetical protein